MTRCGQFGDQIQIDKVLFSPAAEFRDATVAGNRKKQRCKRDASIQVEPGESAEDIEAATKAQAYILIRAVEMSYNKARTLLIEEYPEIDVDVIDAAFQEGLEGALITA